MTRAPQIVLSGMFLAMIIAVPILDAALDVNEGDPPQALDLFRQPPTEENLRGYESQLEDDSHVAQAIRPHVQQLLFRVLGNPGAKALIGRDGWLFYKPDLDYLVEAADESDVQDAVEAIIAFRDQLDRRGIRLLVVPVPGKPSIYPDKLTTRLPAGSRFQSPTHDLLARLGEAGVETVDLFEAFQQSTHHAPRDAPEPERAQPYYLRQDTHWSPYGARLAAESIAGRIHQLGWLEPGTTEYDVKQITIKRPGDILEMLKLPTAIDTYPAEQLQAFQVVRQDNGQPYADDASSPVLLLGDSFSRIYQTDEPNSAGLIAHLARELKMPLASIVNDGGASTLVRQQLRRQANLLEGKKLIVWQFVERDILYGTEGWQPVSLPGDEDRH